MMLLIGLFVFKPSSTWANSQDGTVTIPDDAIRKSIVLVKVSTIQYDYTRPWIRLPGQSFTVAGLVVPGNRILVMASDIRDAVLLEVTGYSSYKKYLGRVVRMDSEANLALLAVDDSSFFSDLSPLKPGNDPVPGQKATAVKVDDVFRVYREVVDITNLGAEAEYGFAFLPVIKFRTTEPFRTGGLLLSGDALVGFIGYSSEQSRIDSFPVSVIRSFYDRAEQRQSSYSGFASQGFFLKRMVDPVLRDYFKLSDDMHGALVTRVLPGTSAWGVLQKNDILLSIDGVPLDDRGYYMDPDLGRQSPFLLLARKGAKLRLPGEVVPVSVFRDGHTVDLEMTLRSYQGIAERIPVLLKGQPPYVVENGLIFLELSVPYLRQLFGPAWENRAIEYAYYFKTKRFYDIPGDDRIVILSRILPDESNRGYESMAGRPVQSVDGRPVRNLRHLKQILEESAAEGKKTIGMELITGERLFLDLKDRSRINERVMQRYSIPASDSWELEKVERK